jgi:hypothetical protein
MVFRYTRIQVLLPDNTQMPLLASVRNLEKFMSPMPPQGIGGIIAGKEGKGNKI